MNHNLINQEVNEVLRVQQLTLDKYLDIQFNVTPKGAQILSEEPASLEELITHYEQKYEQEKDCFLYVAQDALIKSIKCRINKIKRDHCGA